MSTQGGLKIRGKQNSPFPFLIHRRDVESMKTYFHLISKLLNPNAKADTRKPHGSAML